MALGGDKAQTNQVYSSLGEEREPHQYQSLAKVKPTDKGDQNNVAVPRPGRNHGGVGQAATPNPVQSTTGKAKLYSNPYLVLSSNAGGISPLDPLSTDAYANCNGANSEHFDHKDASGDKWLKEHKEIPHYENQTPTDYMSARYIKGQTSDHVNLSGVGYNRYEDKDTYEDIPMDGTRATSMVSLQSTSSSQPILLPRQNKGLCPGRTRRLICLISIIVTVIFIVVLAVSVSLAVRYKDKNSQEQTDTQDSQLELTTTSTSKKTTVVEGSSTVVEGTATGEYTTTLDNTKNQSPQTTTEKVLTTTTPEPPFIPAHTYIQSTLVMVDNPRDKACLAGDSVKLCCLATGSPSPLYYDWYKDNVLMDNGREYTNSSSSLHLSDITTSDSGYYSCRATNAFSSVFSDSALVEVKETETFCESVPKQYQTLLPTGCKYNGQNVVSQGYCPVKPCQSTTAHKADDTDCVDSNQHCCGPISFTTLEIECWSHTYHLSAVQQCGCVACDKTLHSIIGVAQTINGKERYSYGHIYLRNTTTFRNDRFGATGIFELQLENNDHRLVMLTRNVYGYNDFYDWSNHVIHLPNTVTGPYYTSADLRYIEKQSDIITTTENTEKEFTLKDGSPFLSLVMEKSHYYTLKGEIFNGDIEMSANFISGEDMEALQASPGDFMFVSGKGREHPLMAYGLLAIELVGEELPVYYSNNISVSVMGGHFSNVSHTRLWRLGESGYWHVEDNLHEHVDGYQATIHGLQSNTSWFAIARASEWDQCFTKVRVFQGDTTTEGSQLPGASVKLYVTSADGSSMVASARATTDKNNMNGYCIAHPCDMTEVFRLHTTVSYEGQMLNGSDISQNVSLLDMGATGPTYVRNQDCSEANIDTHQYIAFHRDTCEMDTNAITQPLSFSMDQCKDELYLAWHSAQEQTEASFKSCHIKVLVSGMMGHIFSAISIPTAEPLVVDNMYGIRQDCVNSDEVVCLQIKSGGTINCNNNAENEILDETNITIFSHSEDVVLSEIDKTLEGKFNVGSDIGEPFFQFTFPGDTFGIYYGIFCATDASPEAARFRSKRYCFSGKERDSEINVGEINQNRWAIKFQK